MKLAETDLLGSDGPRPIVLLDDVFSELDPDRASRLSGLLGDRGQVIVTTADPAALAGRGPTEAALWHIVDGALERGS
jgi:DNA replication and repair protein RecF